jgi:hypothetical protein
MRQYHDDAGEEPRYANPLSHADVCRARAQLAYEMLELVQGDLGSECAPVVKKTIDRALNAVDIWYRP